MAQKLVLWSLKELMSTPRARV